MHNACLRQSMGVPLITRALANRQLDSPAPGPDCECDGGFQDTTLLILANRQLNPQYCQQYCDWLSLGHINDGYNVHAGTVVLGTSPLFHSDNSRVTEAACDLR